MSTLDTPPFRKAIRQGLPPGSVDKATRLLKVMSHPLRLKLLEVLEGEPRSVTELAKYLKKTQPAVSHQLGILRANGVVEAKRSGQEMRYRCAHVPAQEVLRCVRKIGEFYADYAGGEGI